MNDPKLKVEVSQINLINNHRFFTLLSNNKWIVPYKYEISITWICVYNIKNLLFGCSILGSFCKTLGTSPNGNNWTANLNIWTLCIEFARDFQQRTTLNCSWCRRNENYQKCQKGNWVNKWITNWVWKKHLIQNMYPWELSLINKTL